VTGEDGILLQQRVGQVAEGFLVGICSCEEKAAGEGSKPTSVLSLSLSRAVAKAASCTITCGRTKDLLILVICLLLDLDCDERLPCDCATSMSLQGLPERSQVNIPSS
jgi:hypothetical protein